MTRKALIIIALVMVAMVLTIWAGFTLGRNDPSIVDHVTHTGSQSSPTPATLKSIQYPLPGDGKVDHVAHSATQSTPHHVTTTVPDGGTADVWCATTISNVTAWGLPGYGKLFWGDIRIRQCWGFIGGVKQNRFYDWKVTYTCGTHPNYLWTCDSTPDPDQVVKGSGYSTAPGHIGWLYRYRRAYWKFHYAYTGFPVTARPFAAVTVRADGSYTIGKGDS